MPSLIELCMSGAELRNDDPFADSPSEIDFAVQGKGEVLIGYINWWQQDWNNLIGLEHYKNTSIQEENGVWIINEATPRVTIDTPTDEDRAEGCRLSRRYMDISRDEYLFEFMLLKASFSDIDFDEWLEAVMDRPTVDAVKEFKKSNLGNRKIGRISLISADNGVVDTLVLDEKGNAATATGHPTLTVFVEEWSTMKTRPDVEDYVRWISEQRPYGAFSYGEPESIFVEGHIEDVAQSS